MSSSVDQTRLTLPLAMRRAADAYHRRDWNEAEQLCRAILTARPDAFDSLYMLGMIAAQTQRANEAADWLGRAVSVKPADALARNLYGNVLQALHRFPEAIESYEQALRIQPDYAEAFNNRGVALHALNRFAEAIESYERALDARAGYAEALYNRGLAQRELGCFEEALQSYDLALAIAPRYAEAHNNRGVALQALKRFDEARESYDRALEIDPGLGEAWYGRGNTLNELGRFEEAVDSYARALQIDPGQDWLFGGWLFTKLQLCDWRDLESQFAALTEAIGLNRKCAVPFPVVALQDSLPLQRRAAEIWAGARHGGAPAPRTLERRARRKRIRLGYYSADFHSHATAYLMADLFERHDRSRFELVAFSFGPDRPDDMRRRLSAAFDRFLDVRTRSDAEVARLSRELEIDIALDLKGFTQQERHGIFACRAAPLQVNYLGYPGTMGAAYMDYIVADRIVIPEECRPEYAEKVVYLPHSYQVNDRKRRIADGEFARAELDLPPTGFVFCCFNNNYKIMPDTFAGWMRIIKSVPGSVLWLLQDNAIAADNLRREAAARGIGAERLVFARRMPLPEHLARHRAADLFIDTLPCNAHTTASDALWAGLPVLTRAGESFAARVAASLLVAVGLPELITATQTEYEALAIGLAGNPQRLAELKGKLHKNRAVAPLFDTERYARHLESAYLQMYERYLAGEGPDHIVVQAAAVAGEQQFRSEKLTPPTPSNTRSRAT
jgi:predicted O-linked N-acetylglucosamine transferase (SPINDLY family)